MANTRSQTAKSSKRRQARLVRSNLNNRITELATAVEALKTEIEQLKANN